jgi:hypothetical protein
MKTRKLALGFCALAAVAGATPEVSVLSATDESKLMLDKVIKYTTMDPEMQRKYAETVDTTSKVLEEGTIGLKMLGYEEVASVREALRYERRAFFIFGLGRCNVKLADQKVTRAQCDLKKAEDAVKRARFFTWMRKKKSEKRRAELTTALQHRDHMLAQFRLSCSDGAHCTELAQQCWNKASALRAEQIACITGLTEVDIIKHEAGLKADMDRVECSGISTEELEKLAVHGIQYIAVFNEAIRRCSFLLSIASLIEDALKSKRDDDWPRDLIGKDVVLYREWQVSCPKQPYDHGVKVFEDQRVRLHTALSGCWTLNARAMALLNDDKTSSSVYCGVSSVDGELDDIC